jgi:RNA polymerase sigma-70 factor, ECF subfamily
MGKVSIKDTTGIPHDRQAFEGLFRQYAKPLFYYAAKFIDDEAARDIVQDVFAKLWSDEQITIRKSLNALLFTMVRNGCLQQLEKQKVRSKYLAASKLAIQEEELRYYMDEKTSLIEQEMEIRLNQALNTLPDRCRQIFIMSRFQNKKNREIAGELEISVKAVEKQISRAMAILRSELKDFLPLVIFLTKIHFPG